MEKIGVKSKKNGIKNWCKNNVFLACTLRNAFYFFILGRFTDVESLLSQALSDNHLLNRNIIRIIYGLPKSKTIVDLMKKVIVHHSEDLAEISLQYRKEFLIRAAVYYKDMGKPKLAVECLLDQSHGPNILDDDCK